MSSSLSVFDTPSAAMSVGPVARGSDIIALPDGGFLVATTDWDTSAGGDRRSEHSSTTTAQRYDASGAVSGDPFELFSFDGGQLGLGLESTILADGRIFVSIRTAQSGGGGNDALHVSELGADGMPLAAPVSLNSALINEAHNLERMILDDGRILVVDQVGRTIAAQIHAADGLSAEDPITITSDLGFGELEAAEIAPDGRVLVVWKEQNFESSPSSVDDPESAFSAAFLTPEDGSLSTAFDVPTPELSVYELERLSLVGVDITETDVTAIWREFRSGVEISSSALTLERFDFEGARLGESVPLGGVFGGSFEMEPLGNDLYLLSWQGASVYPFGPSVVGMQVFDGDGRAIGTSDVLFSLGGRDGFIGVPSLARVGDQIVALTEVAGNIEIRPLKIKDPLPGTEEDDTLSLATDGFLQGLGGDDLLVGSEGDDLLDGGAGDDTIRAGAGDDIILGKGGSNTVDGGEGSDFLQLDIFIPNPESTFDESDILDTFTFGENILLAPDRSVTMILEDGSVQSFAGIERLGFGYQTWWSPDDIVRQTARGDHDYLEGSFENNTLNGFRGNDWLMGFQGNDILYGGIGNDTIFGGEGADELHGGDGDDYIHGSDPDDETTTDRRDTIFAGSGDDTVFGGYGNDLIYGMDGNDIIAGGFGADELIGQRGNDTITGSAFSDLIFGNAGDDFINGGFGFDRINGGAGADRFFHAGAPGHGSDWIQDYTAEDGDVLLFGGAGASVSDFVVRFAHTATEAGERSGDDDVEEAFVRYKGETLWALVDGAGETSINLQIGGEVFDLLA